MVVVDVVFVYGDGSGGAAACVEGAAVEGRTSFAICLRRLIATGCEKGAVSCDCYPIARTYEVNEPA